MGSAGLLRNIPIVLIGSGIHSPEFQEFLSPLPSTVLEYVSSIRLLFKTASAHLRLWQGWLASSCSPIPVPSSLGYSGSGVRLRHAAQPELFNPKSFGQSLPKLSRRNKPDFQGTLLPLPFLRPRPSFYELWHQRPRSSNSTPCTVKLLIHQSNAT